MLPPTVRIEAPADMEPHEIAQAAVGPKHRVHVEYDTANSPYRPIADLTKREMHAYGYLYNRMISAIRAFVEKNILLGSLEKAERRGTGDWVLITPAQLDALREIIGDHHEAYVAGMVSPSLLAPTELLRLIEAGILPPELQHIAAPLPGEPVPPKVARPIATAYQYGRQLAAARGPREEAGQREATYEEQQRQPELPLSPAEREAVHWAEEHVAEYVRALSKRVQADLTGAVVAQAVAHSREADVVGESSLTQEDIQGVVVGNLKKREAWRKIVTDLGDESGDWARDLGRIAATEKTRAVQEGQARGMMKEHPGGNNVAKVPAPGACKHCVRLHLTGGPGSPPKVFPLSELAANGSNVGRKAADWLATVGPVHPWCECLLVKVPDGWVFDDSGSLVPEMLTRGERMARNLRKSMEWLTAPVTPTAGLPDVGVSVRVADPAVRAEVDKVIARTPAALFTKVTGITSVTTDGEREGSHMSPGDFAYWQGNEIRLSQILPAKAVKRVLEHEIGHSLNVALFHKLGSVEAVTAWHDRLWAISRAEGLVSTYARNSAVENAAEVCRWWIFYRKQFMLRFQKQHAFCHRAFGKLL